MKKENITVTTYGGYVGRTLRKYFSKYTSKAYIEWQYAVRKHLFKKYMHWFYREIDLIRKSSAVTKMA